MFGSVALIRVESIYIKDNINIKDNTSFLFFVAVLSSFSVCMCVTNNVTKAGLRNTV